MRANSSKQVMAARSHALTLHSCVTLMHAHARTATLISICPTVPGRFHTSKMVFLNLTLIALIQRVVAYRRGARTTFFLKCGHFISKFWRKTRNFAKSRVTHLGPRQNRLRSAQSLRGVRPFHSPPDVCRHNKTITKYK